MPTGPIRQKSVSQTVQRITETRRLTEAVPPFGSRDQWSGHDIFIIIRFLSFSAETATAVLAPMSLRVSPPQKSLSPVERSDRNAAQTTSSPIPRSSSAATAPFSLSPEPPSDLAAPRSVGLSLRVSFSATLAWEAPPPCCEEKDSQSHKRTGSVRLRHATPERKAGKVRQVTHEEGLQDRHALSPLALISSITCADHFQRCLPGLSG
jgi:hypothetical protein